jgi:single-strand DNA-binding protein
MAQGDIQLTVVGNLTADPELRFLASGIGVAAFTIASTPRQLDKASGEWKDGTPTFLDCKVWREAGEHVAESLQRGARVIVTGRLKQENWEDRETGAKRSKFVLDVEEVGPSLRYATAKIQKAQRSGGQGGQPGGGQPATSAEDPWAAQGAQPSRGFGGQATSEEPPPF